MSAADTVASTTVPAFATDESDRIVAWNRAAEALLGRTAEEVLGKPCHELLCGLDPFGNRYCDESCPVNRMAERCEPVHPFELHVRQPSGRLLRLQVSILVLPGTEPSRFTLIHLLRTVGEASARGDLVAEKGLSAEETRSASRTAAAEMARIQCLTSREVEVLRLLASGSASQEIASQLFISLATVRTHIQNVLRKLEVHSQIEAVALAFRRGLI